MIGFRAGVAILGHCMVSASKPSPLLRIRDQLEILLKGMKKYYTDLTQKQADAITGNPDQPLDLS